MDANQAGLTNRPLFERVKSGDERLTQELIDYYLARGRYLHSEFMVQLLAALAQKLKNTFVRTVISLRRAVGKLWGLFPLRSTPSGEQYVRRFDH